MYSSTRPSNPRQFSTKPNSGLQVAVSKLLDQVEDVAADPASKTEELAASEREGCWILAPMQWAGRAPASPRFMP